MSIEFFKRLMLYVVLVLSQALVLNHIHLFGYATPLLYIYFVVSFPRNYPKWGIILWSFLQPYLLEVFMQRDSEDDFQPSISTMGAANYVYFSLLLTFIYCIVFFTVETFTFFNWLQWIFNIVASTLLSLLLIIVIDNLRKK